AILVLAWGLGEAVGALGTDAFVAGFAENTLPPAVLPALVFVLGAFIAFSTGTSWGSMSILTPIVIPVAWQLTGSHTMIAAVVGMIFSGSIFGDHTSPISDTSVLSATFTGADLIDHVRTQLYYASTVAVVAITLILIWGIARVPPLALVAVGVVLLVGIVYALSAIDARRKGITPKAADAPQDESVPHRTTFLGSSDDD
ncbi:MAG: Na+/H+ antiporter NhaC family protein, partial [Salinarchaeum sp.]